MASKPRKDITQIDVAVKMAALSKERSFQKGAAVSPPVPFPDSSATTQSAMNANMTKVWIATAIRFARLVTVTPNQLMPSVTATIETIHTDRSIPGTRVPSATAIST